MWGRGIGEQRLAWAAILTLEKDSLISSLFPYWDEDEQQTVWNIRPGR